MTVCREEGVLHEECFIRLLSEDLSEEGAELEAAVLVSALREVCVEMAWLKVLNILLSLMPSGLLLSSHLVVPSFRLKNIGCLTKQKNLTTVMLKRLCFY